MYKNLLRPLLFLLDAEFSHKLVLKLLRLLYYLPGASLVTRMLLGGRVEALPTELMGLSFRHPVGLAAGMDKNGQCAQAFTDMGFAAVELGTVTPRAQSGNPGKRLYRLPKQDALINRMGFPSVGLDKFLRTLRHQGKHGIIGINIGKNRATPINQAVDDYLTAMRAVYSYADYIVVNISSPNTSHLRELQKEEHLDKLLIALKDEQIVQTKTTRHYVPVAIKIAPDIDDENLANIAELVLKHKIDAVIATNSTIQRPGIEDEPLASEGGGLSGPPLRDLSTEIIRKLYHHLEGKVPIIAVGGITSATDAWEKMVAGADFIQVYTSFVYQGPAVIRRITRGLRRRLKSSGLATLREAVDKARTGVHLMR